MAEDQNLDFKYLIYSIEFTRRYFSASYFWNIIAFPLWFLTLLIPTGNINHQVKWVQYTHISSYTQVLPHWNPALGARHSLSQENFILQPQSTLNPSMIICYFKWYNMFTLLLERLIMVKIGSIRIRSSRTASFKTWFPDHQYYVAPFLKRKKKWTELLLSLQSTGLQCTRSCVLSSASQIIRCGVTCLQF